MKKLIDYLIEHKFSFREVSDNIVEIDSKNFYLVKPNKEGLIFDEEFRLIYKEKSENYIFSFGGKYYWTPGGTESLPLLNELRYLGEAFQQIPTITFLGIHSGFELLNGSRLYKDWVKKAKFLGVRELGICEKNTLSGVLKFQQECEHSQIKPIIGASFIISRDDGKDIYIVKCFVKNKIGWFNLLSINVEVNVKENHYISEEKFLTYLEGLVVVVDPKTLDFDKSFPYNLSEDFYYQLDTVEFEDIERDIWYLDNLKKFILSKFKPVSIYDAYYLEKEDAYIKQRLNGIGGFQEYISYNQYFKSKDEYFLELSELFREEDSEFLFKLFEEAVNNEKKIGYQCNFKIDTSKRHLPRYEMTKEESINFKSNEDLFWSLVEEGLREKVNISEYDKYLERIQLEYSVIQKGDVLDYFLITRDIINWAHRNNILTGFGRGSSGGSLILYLLGITYVNPFRFNLLFERFLNEGRVEVSLPDIDSDFESSRRDEVKRYMEKRFGINQVCSIGTYTTFRLKSAIKDLSKQFGVDYKEVNYITKIIDRDPSGTSSKSDILTLFRSASKNNRLKKFVIENSDIINTVSLLLFQPKAQSIHPCATLILPKELTIQKWIPVKKMLLNDGKSTLVSEWEGEELDLAGFLKEDILGIRQLDKFRDILDLVYQNYKKSIDIYKLPLDKREVYRYFKKGWNGDIFHFGSSGLTKYLKELQPENIEDLVAAIALYRPGTMESNIHNEYILRRKNSTEVLYEDGLEEITKSTYGLVVYQEQIMQICQKIANFTLVEADDIRKALGKMKPEVIESWETEFLKRAIKNGYQKEKVKILWDKMKRFASYAFNHSHSAAYSVTGYIGQWLKVYYPIEYWTIALKYASSNDIAKYISEINKTGKISVSSPDINLSRELIYTDFVTKTIYWSFTDIKMIGGVSAKQIIEEREKNGDYFSFSEFIDRHTFKGSKVNKRVVENLIFSGSFDRVEGIKKTSARYRLFRAYEERFKVASLSNKVVEDKLKRNWWWTLQQKILSNIAFFDYYSLYKSYFYEIEDYPYIDFVEFSEEKRRRKGCIIGFVSSIEKKNTKKGESVIITVENNFDFMNVVVWAEQYKYLDKIIEESLNTLLIVSGEVVYDSFHKQNVLQLNDKSSFLLFS